MKKSIILLLCAFLPLFAFAKIDLLVKGGIGSTGSLERSYRPRLSGQAGVFFSIPFKNDAWSVETGVQWSTRTLNDRMTLTSGADLVELSDVRINGNYLDVPVIFNFRTPIAEKTYFKIGMGLYYARYIGGYATLMGIPKSLIPDEKAQWWGSRDYFETNNTFGGLITGGVEWNKFFVGLEYDVRWEDNFAALSGLNAVMSYRF